MNSSARFLSPSEAANRLGVSAKALRLYEQRGLVIPVRSEAGWRAYGPGEMARAAEIVTLRGLGLSLAQVASVLEGDHHGLEAALAAHQAVIEAQIRALASTVEKIRGLRRDLIQGNAPPVRELARLVRPVVEPVVAFDLPWPWGGELFELRDVRALNYIIGPLGSGKTRLARRLAEALPNAVFLSLERLTSGGTGAKARMDADPVLKARVEKMLDWVVEDGAVVSDALLILFIGMSEGPNTVVIDMIEQGLDEVTQDALIAYLRHRDASGQQLFLLTRSSAILDLTTVGADETIIFCPANHCPPTQVAPHSGAPGYEAMATCLAPPHVRARTEGVVV